MARIDVFIAAHAATVWNERGLKQGQCDPPLSARGFSAATKMAKRHDLSLIRAIYSSDLTRARQTADAIARRVGVPVSVRSSLREANWADHHRDAQYPPVDQSIAYEDHSHLKRRALQAMTALASTSKHTPILVISHSAFITAFLQLISPERALNYRGIRTALNHVRYTDGEWQIISLDDDCHMPLSRSRCVFGAPKSFNVELTNRCLLRCPACARTSNDWVRSNLRDLPLEALERFVADCAQLDSLPRINLCGALGDCVYHPKFHSALEIIKAHDLTVAIETNGSHRSTSWWDETCSMLTPGDRVVFSVDGLRDTNYIYRVNSRWDDIVEAMRFCAQRTAVDWKFVVFRHNEDQVDDALALARQLGLDGFLVKRSARFSDGDPLSPSASYLGVVCMNRRRIESLTHLRATDDDLDCQVTVRPRCMNGYNLALTSQGYVFPCSSCCMPWNNSWFSRHADACDIAAIGLEDVLANTHWRELQTLWTRASTSPEACLRYCGVHRDFDELYRTNSPGERPYTVKDETYIDLRSTG